MEAIILLFFVGVNLQPFAINSVSSNNGYNRLTYHNRNFQNSKAQLERKAKGTSLPTSVASDQRNCPKSKIMLWRDRQLEVRHSKRDFMRGYSGEFNPCHV